MSAQKEWITVEWYIALWAWGNKVEQDLHTTWSSMKLGRLISAVHVVGVVY